MSFPEKCAAIITAAGLSSRMGSSKALIHWQGQTLLSHQLSCLADWGQVVVVTGFEAERLRASQAWPDNTREVWNPDFESGRSSSLQVGFDAIAGHPHGILVTGVDQPLDPLILNALLGALTPSTSFIQPLVGDRRGHPILFAGELLGELRAIAGEPEGLRSIVQRHSERGILLPVASQLPLADLNTPQDVAFWASEK